MARRPTQIGHAGAPLRLVPLDPDPPAAAGFEGDDDRTTVEQEPEEPPAPKTVVSPPPGPPADTATSAAGPAPRVDEQWDEGSSTIDEQTMANTGAGDSDAVEELTVDEGRATIAAMARLVVIAGNDTGREFPLVPGKVLSIGRAIENEIVLTDIAVSRRHLDVAWDGSYWVLKDRGSGNGTLVNERIEDGACRLQHQDRIEIGHTVFRFDHPLSAAPPVVGFGAQNSDDDEASTVAGRGPGRPGAVLPPPGAAAPVPVQGAGAARKRPTTQPPPTPADRRRATLPPPRPRTTSSAPPPGGAVSSRLALPPSPAAPVEDAPFAAEPVFLQGAATPTPTAAEPVHPGLFIEARRGDLRPDLRTMTATAHVEPLAYSGSLPPIGAYPYPDARVTRRRVAIGALVGAGVVMIGVIAMIAGGDGHGGADGEGPSARRDAAERSAAKGVAGEDPPLPPPSAGERALGAGTGVADRGDPPAPPGADPPGADPAVGPTGPPEPEPGPAPERAVTRDETPPPTPKKEPPPPPPKKEPAPAIARTPPPPKKTPPPPPPKKTPPVRTAVAEKKPPAGGADAARRKAASLYAAKDFRAAAAAAREAATGDDAAAMRALAADYDALATSWAEGNSAAAARPTDAMIALRRALAADKKLGGTHAPMIREKLAQVAPKAAAGFMAKGNYEAAKQAVDTAVNFGAGSSPTVLQVRESLERKAGELYASGQKALASSPDEAKALFRRVLKIVPPDSPWYTKAYQALNARKKKKDEDE